MNVSTTIEPSRFELPPYKSLDNAELSERIEAVRRELGSKLLILGHHYQQDEVIEHSDLRGDSYQLSQMAAESSTCKTIVFCGVHFMAETADILANTPHKVASRDGRRVEVILPDMAAGIGSCSGSRNGVKADHSPGEGALELLDTAVIRLDESGRVTEFNSAAGQCLGVQKDRVMGQVLTTACVLPPERITDSAGTTTALSSVSDCMLTSANISGRSNSSRLSNTKRTFVVRVFDSA